MESTQPGANRPAEPRAYLTKQQLATRSGLSPATVQRLKDAGLIPFVQPSGKGGKLLFPPDAIERAHAQQSATIPSLSNGNDPQQLAAAGPPSLHPTNENAGRRALRGPRPRWQQQLPGATE